MAGSGAGPSRRSHTKSRKGCKTCKRRHIRCDETFPQCRNCTKHQVRCDYMEGIGSDTESQQSPEQNPLTFSPDTESRIDHWKDTGSFPYPELQVFPPPPTMEYSKNELRLIHHLSKVSHELRGKGTSDLTIWTEKLPKFLSIAGSYPYVMHSLLSFSANNLVWTEASTETRNLQNHHGSIALRGLHEAIASFSHANADAVLASSLLLLWQANDWRSWSSLRSGIQSVLATMQPFTYESIFAEFINEEGLATTPDGSQRRASAFDPEERAGILSSTIVALQQLQVVLNSNEPEYYWIAQLLEYVESLCSCSPAVTPDEQFNHLYLLRKWLFWVPASLLRERDGHGPALLTVAHFYAVALILEPLFPDISASFCANIALAPLNRILLVTEAMHLQSGLGQASMEIASLMQFPKQAATSFRNQGLHAQAAPLYNSQLLHLNSTAFGLSSSISDLSPGFAPATIHYHNSGSASAPVASFLGVPTAAGGSGFTYGTQSWGTAPSPGFPSQAFTADIDSLYEFERPPPPALGGSGFHQQQGGFVPPQAAIWT